VAWALAAFTLVATALGHRFWEADPAFFFNQMTHFLKNLAVIGGLLVLAEKRA
jgi:putative oxidoreductase